MYNFALTVLFSRAKVNTRNADKPVSHQPLFDLSKEMQLTSYSGMLMINDIQARALRFDIHADRYRSPAHTEDTAANGEMHLNKTPARANQWERSCFTSLSAWPCLVRTCDRGRRLLVGLFKHHRLGAEDESYTLLQINKSKTKTQWLLWLPAMDALTPLSLFIPPKDPHLPSRASHWTSDLF